MVNNPHQLLGVSENATQDEIKRAYRRKAKECHPDLHPNDPDAARKMNELNEAYDMLMNPEKYAGRRQQGNPYGGNPYGGNPYGGNPYGGYSGQSSSGQQGGYNPYGQYQQGGYNPYGQRQQGSYNQQGGYGQGGWQSDFGGFGFGFEDLFGFGGQTYQAAPPTEQPGDSELVRQAIRAMNQRQYQAAIAHLQNVVSAQRNARWFYLSGVANHGAGNTIQAAEHMTRACQMDPNNGLYRSLLNQYRRAGQTYTTNGQGYSRAGFNPMTLCYLCCMLQWCCPYGGVMCC
ncbi:MAG: DnaJ domain-containing protein [Clostridia bacterium]|nr:DnaJ domain-containing protein [Clostridia bacterium]